MKKFKMYILSPLATPASARRRPVVLRCLVYKLMTLES